MKTQIVMLLAALTPFQTSFAADSSSECADELKAQIQTLTELNDELNTKHDQLERIFNHHGLFKKARLASRMDQTLNLVDEMNETIRDVKDTSLRCWMDSRLTDGETLELQNKANRIDGKMAVTVQAIKEINQKIIDKYRD